MRRLCTALVLVAATAGHAAADSPLESRKGDRPFWSWVIAPHQIEIATILEKVQANRDLVNSSSYDPSYLDTHRRALDDALGMLRYALRLDPKDPLLLRTYAEVAADRGLLAEAAGAYERYFERTPENDPHSLGQLGIIYAQQGRYAEAIEPLRAGVIDRSPAAIHTLALVYMERGRVSEAIDLLNHAPHRDSAELLLALAIAYDRDEQVGEAAEILGKLGAALQGSRFGRSVTVPYTPAIDQRYFAAMLFESANRLDDARAEWMAYATARPAPRYRDRALAHIAAIDRLRGRR